MPRRTALAVAATCAVAAFAPGIAHGAQSDFCGTVTSSGAYCAGYNANGWSTWWTYTSNTYTGGGNIDHMYACMADGGVFFSRCWTNQTAGTKFIGGCWYKNYTGGSGDYGVIRQDENSGAAHTIYGHNDDSPNHSGCIAAHLV